MLDNDTTTQTHCSICNKPVDLTIAKTDDNGKAVHAQCYVMAVVAKVPKPPNEQAPSL